MNRELSARPLDRRVIRLTQAQKRALELAESDGELQIGGTDGRAVRRDVAERLVCLGLLTRTATPLPGQAWWGYRRTCKPYNTN